METREPATGPISPELVLVDPDLAAGARAALPDHPWPAPARIQSPTPTLQRRIPVAAILSFLSFAALVGILGVSLLPSRDQPTFAAEGQRIQPAASPSGARKLPRFKPARTFAWVSQARAAYYQVAFFRNGRRFYQRRTRSARVTLPRRVRFTPGDYRWTVRPAFRARNGMRLADPIVDSTFRIGRE